MLSTHTMSASDVCTWTVLKASKAAYLLDVRSRSIVGNLQDSVLLPTIKVCQLHNTACSQCAAILPLAWYKAVNVKIRVSLGSRDPCGPF